MTYVLPKQICNSCALSDGNGICCQLEYLIEANIKKNADGKGDIEEYIQLQMMYHDFRRLEYGASEKKIRIKLRRFLNKKWQGILGDLNIDILRDC